MILLVRQAGNVRQSPYSNAIDALIMPNEKSSLASAIKPFTVFLKYMAPFEWG